MRDKTRWYHHGRQFDQQSCQRSKGGDEGHPRRSTEKRPIFFGWKQTNLKTREGGKACSWFIFSLQDSLFMNWTCLFHLGGNRTCFVSSLFYPPFGDVLLFFFFATRFCFFRRSGGADKRVLLPAVLELQGEVPAMWQFGSTSYTNSLDGTMLAQYLFKRTFSCSFLTPLFLYQIQSLHILALHVEYADSVRT